MDCSLPGSSVHVIFQERVLEWGAIKSILIRRQKNVPWMVPVFPAWSSSCIGPLRRGVQASFGNCNEPRSPIGGGRGARPNPAAREPALSGRCGMWPESCASRAPRGLQSTSSCHSFKNPLPLVFVGREGFGRPSAARPRRPRLPRWAPGTCRPASAPPAGGLKVRPQRWLKSGNGWAETKLCAKHGVALRRGKRPQILTGRPLGGGDTIPGLCLGGRRVKPPASVTHQWGDPFPPAETDRGPRLLFLGSEISPQLFLKGLEVPSAPAFTAAGPADLPAEPMGRPAPCPGRVGPLSRSS